MQYLYSILLVFCVVTVGGTPQQPEINDQFETSDAPVDKIVADRPDDVINIKDIVTTDNDIVVNVHNEVSQRLPAQDNQETFTVKIYNFITGPIIKFISAPKVNTVLRNVGTCIVNGAMEIISYYLPAPVIPLLASAAGMVIPFEPVVMLKQKMPVTSYRRAFKTAVNSFMSTFDKYKIEEDFDPYMTRRFNRRFMNEDDNGIKNVNVK